MEKGYFMGTTDIYGAEMLENETATSAPEYGPVRLLAKSVNIKLSPKYKEGSLYASNSRVRSVKRLDYYEGEFDLDALTPEDLKLVLGRKTDANGVQLIKGNNEPPYYALAFGFTKDNGAMELWWMFRAKFAEQEIDRKTEEDKIEYQTPKLAFTADRRLDTDDAAAVVDSDDSTIPQEVIDSWFDEVYEPEAVA